MADDLVNAASERLAQLAALVARVAPITAMAEVVFELRLLPDFELRRRAVGGDPDEARTTLAQVIVAQAAARGVIPDVARAFYRRLWLDPGAVDLVVYMQDARPEDTALQAALVLRANTLRLPELRRFLAECEHRVCVIAAVIDGVGTRLGTGFLVGRDRVLTAYHTLARHLDGTTRRDPAPGKLYALFDYFDGDTVVAPDPPPAGVLRVPFHTDWLLVAREALPGDGELERMEAADLAEMRQRLDFALIRLQDPVGLQSRQRVTGGERRAWFTLDRPPPALQQDHRVIIPQHPDGYPQRIDFGRFSEAATALDASATRLRYDTGTAPGTSGAPCFDQNFKLVGMHNATLLRKGQAVANQAIRLENILDALHAQPLPQDQDAAPAPPAAPFWSVSRDIAAPSAILGRPILLRWIEAAAAVETGGRAQRIYAAVCRGEGAGSTHGFGKSFSIDILKAARWGRAERIVLLGTQDELLPAQASDVLRVIADQLAIPQAALADMPPRPDLSQPIGDGDDKLHKWSSEKLPTWFAGVLQRYRQVEDDLCEQARKARDALQAIGQPVPADVLALANSAEAHIALRSRWDIAWIAIDRLSESRISDEVRELLSGLTGGKLAEPAVPTELRRLRWLFLGYRPGFFDAAEVTQELLDPAGVGTAEIMAVTQAMADAFGREFDAKARAWLEVYWQALNDAELLDPSVANPNLRLQKLQRFFSVLAPQLRQQIGVTA